MFHNTENGDYQDNGLVTSYSFPKEAVFKVNNISIPLGGLTVECFGGRFDGGSVEHFAAMASLLRSYGEQNSIHNTPIFIIDNDISGTGCPGRDDFVKYGLDYLSRSDFLSYQEKVFREKPATGCLYDRLICFFKKWSNDNRKILADKINQFVTNNEKFPKNLSIIYDDRLIKHTSHIILSFQTPNQCVLHIDNTMSILDMLIDLITDKNIIDNAEKYHEKIANDESKVIELYTDQKLVKKLELAKPANQFLFETIYNRMKIMLQGLGLQIKDVKIHHSPYNQKNTEECVVFAIQNKLDFVTGNECQTNEMPRQKGIRLRAEHAVLSYLLTGKTFIPRYSEQDARDAGIKYDEASWYPNFHEVCKKLDEAIKSLSFQELNEIYLAIELGEVNINSTKFTDLILSTMKEKMPDNEYTQITNSELDENRAKFLEKTGAPGIFYRSENKSLFMSNTLLFSLKESLGKKKDTVDIDKDVEYIVKHHFV